MDNFDWRKTIKTNLLVLRFVGLWPQGYESFKPDLYLIYSLIVTIGFIGGHDLSQVANIFTVYSNLEALTATIFVAATNTFAIMKRYLFIKNLKVIKSLFITLNTNEFLPKNDRHLKLVEVSVKKWELGYTLFTLFAILNVLFWIFVPIINGWVKERVLPFQAWYPFSTKQSPNYEIAYLYQTVCICYIVLANLNLDVFICAFLMFIGVQCDILAERLKHLEEGNFDEDLVKCIKHHRDILKFASDINNFFNLIIFGQIATSTASLALSMFQLSLVGFSDGAAFTQIAYMFGMSTEIFFYCWFGNEVEIKSNQIPYAAYESNWIGHSQSTLRNLIIFCEKCQSPIKITAMNLFTFSLETFIAILRTAWSYYAVLSTVNSK